MSVEFDPVPIGRRRRRTDPVVIVVVLVLVGLATAVIKPWERGRVAPNDAAAASTLVEASVEPRPSGAAGLRIDIVTVDRSSPARPLDHPVFAAEYLTPSADGPTVLDTDGRPIVALGIAPHAEGVVEDVRIWLVGPAGSLRSFETAPVGGVATGGAVVLAPEGQPSSFSPGRYRIEAVVDGESMRLEVLIPTPETATRSLSWADVERAPSPSPSFGVATITVDRSASDGHQVFAEGWHQPTPDGSTILDTRGQSVVALGVATASGSIAVDVRIWRLRPGGSLEWVDAQPIDGAVTGGPLVLAIPGQAIAFPAGEYRVDALVDGAIRRIDVAIPGPGGTVPFATGPTYPSVAGLVPLSSSDPSVVLSGPFLTVDGRAVPLDVMPVEPLDETGAWQGSVAALNVTERPTVARLFQPRATGMGVMLTSHARIQTAEIVRLAPDAALEPITAIGGVSYNHGGTPWVGFDAPGGGAWPPGVYAMTIAWVDGTERRVETWHVELRPGPTRFPAAAPG